MKESGEFTSAAPVILKADPCYRFFDRGTAEALTNSAMTVTAACGSEGVTCKCGKFDPWGNESYTCPECK